MVSSHSPHQIENRRFCFSTTGQTTLFQVPLMLKMTEKTEFRNVYFFPRNFHTKFQTIIKGKFSDSNIIF